MLKQAAGRRNHRSSERHPDAGLPAASAKLFAPPVANPHLSDVLHVAVRSQFCNARRTMAASELPRMAAASLRASARRPLQPEKEKSGSGGGPATSAAHCARSGGGDRATRRSLARLAVHPLHVPLGAARGLGVEGL